MTEIGDFSKERINELSNQQLQEAEKYGKSRDLLIRPELRNPKLRNSSQN